MYYQNSVGALFVWTIFETFKKVETWVHTLQEAVGKDITFLIAGNKVDLKDKNKSQEHTSEIDSYCAKEHCKYFYTSAKTGYNLDKIFECLINIVFSKIKPKEGGGSKRRGKRIEIFKQKEKKEKRGCC